MRFSILISLLSLTISLSAQNKSCDKALKLYEQKNYKSADKAIDKCLLETYSSKNPNILLLKSKIQLAIFNDKTLAEKYPNALKEALKYAEKAIEANQGIYAQEAFKKSNEAYFYQLIKINNKEALFSYNGNKFSKALPLFKKSIFFGMDTISMVYGADCYWQLEQWDESLNLYKKSAEIIYTAVLDSNMKVAGYQRTPFIRLCEYYINHKLYDSAYIYVKNGRAILPNDPDLNVLTYNLMRIQLEKIPPSFDYLSFTQNGLRDFPADSFLNHRENSIYIYLLNGMAEAKDNRQFDSLFTIYASSKADKSKLNQLAQIKKYDIFAGMSPIEFSLALTEYFANSSLEKAAYYAAKNYLKVKDEQALSPEKMAQYIPTLPQIKLVELTYRFYIEENPKASVITKSLSEYTSKKNKEITQYYDLLPLIRLNEMCKKHFPKIPEFTNIQKNYRLRLINESADSGDFRLARTIWIEASKLYPDQAKNLDISWKKIVTNDFKINYFGSRINLKGKTEKGVPEYSWNGIADSCKWGTISDDVILNAQQRINYFRRMAGMTEMISLTKQDNEMCMIAVLMCEANRSMSHEPNDGWRCFIPAGADALQNAILSKDANPAIAITAAMGQNHTTVGNRRWLLYPNALYMGIGTSKSYTAIKAIDESRGLDTLKYQSQFIAWPPANACPKMLVFKKWSFSIDLDLKDASVSMKDANGQMISLNQEPYAIGYGMNTIVWEPNINVATLSDDALFHITIKLKNGKTFNYTVKVIDIKL
ncbi:MAG: hypothetical protein IT245_05365 [Bacteroidia bacterium]|nr:hypothetical protein [Bacteroidia bacterium]